jgi:hypothetical protein
MPLPNPPGPPGRTESQRRGERRADIRAHERDVEAYKQQRPAEGQRDATSLGALAQHVQQSKPLASRAIGSSKPMGLMKPGSRSMTR